MKQIIETLQYFHFSKVEAQVYICLLQNYKLNGSQIAKCINVPRTSVYSALDNLYKKGVVFMLPGESNIYGPQNPKVLIENLKNEYSSAIEILDNRLKLFEGVTGGDQYWNIKDYENFTNKTKEMLLNAKKEVYISTNQDLRVFSDEIKKITKKGIRVVVFSFEKLKLEDLNVEFYYNSKKIDKNKGQSRIMLLIDKSDVMIASGNINGEYLGTFTQNPLLVSIVKEHICHDIYLLELEKHEK